MTISVTVIAAIMVIAVIALIPVLLQVRRTAREVERLTEMVRMQVAPLSHDATIISQQINGILKSVHRQVDGVEEGIATFRDGALRLRELQESMLGRVETPLRELAALVGGLSRGVETFIRALLR